MTNKDCTGIITATPVKGRESIAPPIKDINRWPAIILAVSRKVKAKGRIKFLNSSTRAINLTNPRGVPLGTKWHRKSEKDFTQPKTTTPTQKEKDRGKFLVRCEVIENRCGNKDKKFIEKISIKIEPIKR